MAEAEARGAQKNTSSSHSETSEDEHEDDSEEEEGASESADGPGSESDDEGVYLSGEDDTPDAHDPRAKVLSVLELEDLFVKAAPDLSCECLCLDSTKW